jgi:DNA-directed RNA polymerase specialized sigma24 family protein
MPEQHPRTAPAAPGAGNARPRDAETGSSPEAEARLDADRRLWDQLAAEQFSGCAYRLFEEELFRYAHPIVLAWIRSGRILDEARRRGARGVPAPSNGGRATPAADDEDLAQETIILALRRFRDDAVAGRGWTPDKGAAVTTYFVGGCVFAFVEVHRRWRRELTRRRRIGEAAETDLRREPAPADPADVVVAFETIAERLGSGSPAQLALFLGAAGYTRAETAEILGTTTRAVEGWLRRHRRRLRNGETG